MCGIIAYSGEREVLPVLMRGLQRLEYRGYDSAGVALSAPDGPFIYKSEGKVSRLAEMVEDHESVISKLGAKVGIAHTRWATHGPPTTVNAHPHSSANHRIVLVHNGIIENYQQLKTRLLAEDRNFESETDTEVLAHLIDHHLEKVGSLPQAVRSALKEVHGTFGIACMSADEPELLVVARRGSPIVIGIGEDECVVASDATAIIHYTRQVVYLHDDDLAIIRGGDLQIESLDASPVERHKEHIDWSDDAADKGGYDHYMHKEIFEQPEAIQNAIRGRLDLSQGNAVLGGLDLDPRELSQLRRIVLLGCGTSMNAGLVGEYAIEDFAGMLAEVEQAAEYRYRNPIVMPTDLVLAISQSGETADTLAAIREAEEKGALTAGLVNTVGSTIARETGRGIYLHAGPEISVASTKAFTCQVSVLLLLTLKLARGRRLSREAGHALAEEIQSLPDLVRETLKLDSSISELAANFVDYENYFYIGRGYHFPVALEGALKLKEVSYVHAEAYHAAELKHGPIALLEEKMPVVAIMPHGPGQEKTLGNVAECRARNAPVLGIVTEGDQDAKDACTWSIEIPPSSPCTSTITTTVALQLFAYHVARLRGCEIDQPRNLAKSVTVE